MSKSSEGLPTSINLAYSAPGKALLAGGYLVLVPDYSAYVVALSARMHALIKLSYSNSLTTSSIRSSQKSSSKFTLITARSPQFSEGEWIFSVFNEGPLAYQAKSLYVYFIFEKNFFFNSLLNVNEKSIPKFY